MVQDASIIDLFAGTGSLGIEALSRGAARATFIDSDRVAVDCIRYNLEALGFASESTVIRADVNRWIDSQTAGRATATPFLATEDSPLVVLADPPYAFTEWNELLERLHPRLAPFGVDAIVVLESGKAIELPDTWECDREARYGAAHVTFARPASAAHDGQSDENEAQADDAEQDEDES